MKTTVQFIVTLLLLTPMVAAQNTGEIGLLFKFNPTTELALGSSGISRNIVNRANVQGIGVHYQFLDDVALQPSLMIGRRSLSTDFKAEDGSSYKAEFSGSVFGIELLVPYYFYRADNISVFAAPGLRYFRVILNTEFDSDEFFGDETDIKYNETNLVAYLGSQVNFGRFALFACTGFDVSFFELKQKIEWTEDVDFFYDYEVKTSGTAFSTVQLSIGMIFIVN